MPFDEYDLHDFPDRAIRKLLEHPRNLRDLIEAVAPELAPGFDFDHVEQVPRDFLLEDWRGRESDLLFRIPFRSEAGEQPVLVCVLIEHQSGSDPQMPLRILLYSLLYWEKEWKDWQGGHPPGEPLRLSPVVPIVFHTGQGRWTTHRELADLVEGPDELRRFAPRWPVLFWDLAERSPQELLESAGGWLRALAIVRAEREETDAFLKIFGEVLSRLEAIGATDHVRWHDLMWFVLSWAFRRRSPKERRELEQTARKSHTDRTRRKEVTKMASAVKQSWEQLLLEQGEAKGRQEGQNVGRKEGRKEGRKQGELRARREDLKALLQDRFGVVPDEVLRRIDKTTDTARLKAALLKVWHVQSPDELEL